MWSRAGACVTRTFEPDNAAAHADVVAGTIDDAWLANVKRHFNPKHETPPFPIQLLLDTRKQFISPADRRTLEQHPFSTTHVIYAAFSTRLPRAGIYVGQTSETLLARAKRHFSTTASHARDDLPDTPFHHAIWAAPSSIMFIPLDIVRVPASQAGARTSRQVREDREMAWVQRLRSLHA